VLLQAGQRNTIESRYLLNCDIRELKDAKGKEMRYDWFS
jgi:hypothetical protein